MEELERNGQIVRRAPLPRVELRYLVTAWTSDHGDERALLSGLMRAILAHEEIPATFVAAPIEELPPLTLLMARAGDEHPDVGAVLDGQLKPGDVTLRFHDFGPWDRTGVDVLIEVKSKWFDDRARNRQDRADTILHGLTDLAADEIFVGVYLTMPVAAWAQSDET